MSNVSKMFKSEEELLVRTWIIGEDSNGGLRLIITNANEVIASTGILNLKELEDHLKVQLNLSINEVNERNNDDTVPLYIIKGDKDEI